MNKMYCLDANSLITSWNVNYRVSVFNQLWDKLAEKKEKLILIEPIFNEIDPISQTDKKLSQEKKREKYPLRMWMIENQLSSSKISHDVELLSLNLEQKYEVNPQSKGASQTDITLIAFAKIKKLPIVTLEAEQPNIPGKLCNYKIPLICKKENVEYLDFMTLIEQLGMKDINI